MAAGVALLSMSHEASSTRPIWTPMVSAHGPAPPRSSARKKSRSASALPTVPSLCGRGASRASTAAGGRTAGRSSGPRHGAPPDSRTVPPAAPPQVERVRQDPLVGQVGELVVHLTRPAKHGGRSGGLQPRSPGRCNSVNASESGERPPSAERAWMESDPEPVRREARGQEPQGMAPARERRRTRVECGAMRLVATGGIIGIAVMRARSSWGKTWLARSSAWPSG